MIVRVGCERTGEEVYRGNCFWTYPEFCVLQLKSVKLRDILINVATNIAITTTAVALYAATLINPLNNANDH